ncbi:MAG: hypothetical protein JWN15_3100 [Firmicutes bacterium]|nr:hypothetical protein [Bacillota bacterium]
MPKFMVLTHDQPVQQAISPEEGQRIMQKYIDWSINLRKRTGVFSAEKLADNEGRVLRARGGEVIVTDGPYLESKEVLGGYWMFEAASYDEALQIVGDHPSLALGGTLEIRQVDAT